MLFIVDEDLDNRIYRGVRRRHPEVDIIRVQDIGLKGASDPDVLRWSALHNRLILTHDVNTMTYHFRAFIGEEMSSPGIVFVPQTLAVGIAIADIHLIASLGEENDFVNQMVFLPLR